MALDQHVLIGRTILEVYVREDQSSIKFTTDQGDIEAWCEGDCCSSTWIEDVIDAQVLIGVMVIVAEDIALPEHMRQPTQHQHCEEEMEYYGFKIASRKGVCTLAYRNSSNGYYGGSLVWKPGDDSFYGGVYGQNVPKGEWRKVA